MSQETLILKRVHQGVLILTLNRPEKKNALTVPMYQALSRCIDEADRDPMVGAVVICAAGETFTAGNDMADFRERAVATEPGTSSGLEFIEHLMACEIPIVASVQGWALGIGTTVLLHCDFVLASPDARFKTPFVDLGLCPEAASSLLMPLMLGFRRANELLLAGDTFTAEQAVECQLVNRLCAKDSLLDESLALAAKLAAKPADSLRLSKTLLRRYWRDAIQEALEIERGHFGERLKSADCRAALDQFFGR